VAPHVGLERSRLGIRLEICVTREPNIANHVQDGTELNGSFAEVMRIVLEMNLADTFLTKPANFLHWIEAGVGGITDVVVDQDILGCNTVQDARIIFSGDSVLEAQNHVRLDGLRSEFAERFNRV